MSMAFRGDVDTPAPTHKLVTRDRAGIRDWDETGIVTVENRALDVLMEYGTSVRLEVDSNHSRFDAVERQLTSVDTVDRLFVDSTHEFAASLQEDRRFLTSFLSVSPGETTEWTDRLFHVEAVAVLRDGSWLYRSVPHEPHIREINARECAELIEELHELFDQVQGSAVVPLCGDTS